MEKVRNWWKAVTGILPNKKKAVQYAVVAAVIGLLEVISFTSAFPLVWQIFSKADLSAAWAVPLELTTLSPHLVLVSVISLFVIKNISLTWLQSRQLAFADRLYIELSARVFTKFYGLSLDEFARENSSEIFRKIKTTAYDFTTYIVQNIWVLASEIVVLVAMITLLLLLDFRTTFFFFLFLAPVVCFYYLFRKRVILKVDRAFRNNTPQANIVLGQAIDGFAEVVLYRKKQHFIRLFREISQVTVELLSRLKLYSSVPSRLVETVGLIILSLITLYMTFAERSFADILLFFSIMSIAMYRLAPSFAKIVVSLSQIQSYSYTVQELAEILSRKNVVEASETVSLREQITFRNVSFTYPSTLRSVLRTATFDIKRGDFAVLRGQSGSGKTTILNLFAGLIRPSSGEILVDGQSLWTKDNPFHLSIGLVQQSPVILQADVLSNIAFGEKDDGIDMKRIDVAVVSAGLTDFVSSLPNGLKTVLGENGLTVSGGQRHRIALARALYRDPEVLLLDEVTSQLDHAGKLDILQTLSELNKQGKTIVLASHENPAVAYSNRCFNVVNGEIREHYAGALV